MIFDEIQNSELYYGLGEKIGKALKFLRESDFSDMEPGRIDIDGDDIFALVQKYSTILPDDGKWEAHRKYIDIQYVAKGSEDFGFVNIEYLDPMSDYDSEKDIQWFEGDGDFLQLHENEFVIVYPHEAHMPKLTIEEQEEVLKVVVKVSL